MSLVSWKEFDGELRRGRLLREEGTRAIVEYASGSDGYDRTTVVKLREIQDPEKEKICREIEALRTKLEWERYGHFYVVQSLEQQIEALELELGGGELAEDR